MGSNLTAGRVAAFLTAIAAIAGGLAPVVADLDVTSTAGVIAAVLAIAGVFREWLKGWRQYEAVAYVDGQEPAPVHPKQNLPS